MDLSKSFNWIFHDFIIPRLLPYGLFSTDLKSILSNLGNYRQCVKIDNTHSNFMELISVALHVQFSDQ